MNPINFYLVIIVEIIGLGMLKTEKMSLHFIFAYPISTIWSLSSSLNVLVLVEQQSKDKQHFLWLPTCVEIFHHEKVVHRECCQSISPPLTKKLKKMKSEANESMKKASKR